MGKWPITILGKLASSESMDQIISTNSELNCLVFDEELSFIDAVRIMDRNGFGVLPIIDDQERFLGLITDGDIRKAVVNGSSNLKELVNWNPLTEQSDTPRPTALKKLRMSRHKHLPILDSKGKLVEILYMGNHEFNIKPNPVVIMAGGLGTRLGELTQDTPKPMIEVGDKPILENLVEQCRQHGFIDIHLSVNYKSDQIREYFGNGEAHGVNISYIEEKKRMGTGGGLSLYEGSTQDPILVINGDIVTNLDFSILVDHHQSEQSLATICVRKQIIDIPYGVMDIEQKQVVGIQEKPRMEWWVNAGIYVLDPSCLKRIPRDKYLDLPDLLNGLITEKQKVSSFEIHDLWFDVGSINDLESARLTVRNHSI